jgi:hypothetical protein
LEKAYGIIVQNNPINWIDPIGLWTFAVRINLTFFTGDVTIAAVLDGNGGFGLQFTAATGLSVSTGVTAGITYTEAPCIKNLEGPGTSVGEAINIPGIPIPGFGIEANRTWTGWPHEYEKSYKGFDFGAGLGYGIPFTPQAFTGSTVTLWKNR